VFAVNWGFPKNFLLKSTKSAFLHLACSPTVSLNLSNQKLESSITKSLSRFQYFFIGALLNLGLWIVDERIRKKETVMVFLYILAGLLIAGGLLAIRRQKLAAGSGGGPVKLGLRPHEKPQAH
jgi:hypothetical protein